MGSSVSTPHDKDILYLRTVYDTYISCQDGTNLIQSADRKDSCQFMIEFTSRDKVSLKCLNNERYISAKNKEYLEMSESRNETEYFTPCYLGGKVSFKTCHDSYISVNKEYKTYQDPIPGETSDFVIEYMGKFTL